MQIFCHRFGKYLTNQNGETNWADKTENPLERQWFKVQVSPGNWQFLSAVNNRPLECGHERFGRIGELGSVSFANTFQTERHGDKDFIVHDNYCLQAHDSHKARWNDHDR